MAYEHRLNQTLYVDNTPIPSAGIAETFTASGRSAITEDVPGGSSDLQIAIAIDASAVASLFMYAARDMTVKTNSSSVPDVTISLKAGQPLHWQPDSYFADPLEGDDVTSVFVTLAAGDAAELIIDVIQDATP